MNFGEMFPDGEWATAAAQAVPAIYALGQARKAKIDYQDFKSKIEKFQRQDIVNPYANMSNPYENLSVATQAAEMQAEQADIALANTLDTLRQTGAGGATALAQAALQSKKGISADIEKQEATNQRLQAQGQSQLEMAQARGQMMAFNVQEKREQQELNRLQAQMEQARLQQLESRQAGISALGSGLETLAGSFVENYDFNQGQGVALDTGLVNQAAANNAQTNLLNLQEGQKVVQQLGRTKIKI
jgi:hypothetical protein